MFKPLQLTKVLRKFQQLPKPNMEAPLQEAQREEALLWETLNAIPIGILILDKEQARFINRYGLNFFEISESAGLKEPFLQHVRNNELLNWLKDGVLNVRDGFRNRLTFFASRAVISSLEIGTPEDGIRSLTFLDISDNLTALEEKFRSERLESITKLVSIVAHEIKNPLHSLALHIKLLDETISKSSELSESSRKDLRANLAVIESETNRLNNLTNQFLKFGELKERIFIVTDIHRLIDSVLAVFRPELEARQIELSVSWDSRIPKLPLQPERMYQVFFNLIKNALEALPKKGGRLSLKTSQLHQFCKLEVRDNGRGIAPGHLEKIFEPYFSDKKEGSGLGLPIAKETIENHGGRILVESEEGKGSLFTVLLPLKQEKPKLPRG